MNKKGFTLLEIVICVVLITIISFSIVFIYKKNKNDDLKKIEKEILSASEVYTSMEKDNLGNTYLNGIYKGGEGVIIPIDDLVKKGYIKEKVKLKLLKDVDPEDAFVIVGYKSDEECQSGVTITAGWVDKTTYICSYKTNSASTKTNSLYDTITSLDYYTNCKDDASGFCLLKNSTKENIVDENKDGTVDDVYYFKGNVDNNYLKIEGIDDKLFRIVRTTENQNIKIVDNVPIGNYYNPGYYMSYASSYPNSFEHGDTIFIDGVEGYNRFSMSTNGYLFTIKRNSVIYSTDNIQYINWYDNQEFQYKCNDSFGAGYSTCQSTPVINYKSTIYENIYKPIESSYEEIKDIMESYIDKEYKWCFTRAADGTSINSTSIKCKEEKTLQGDFGLLNLFEFKILKVMLDDYTNAQLYGRDIRTYVSFDYYYTYAVYASPLADSLDYKVYINNYTDRTYRESYILPTYVIKGNSKVISGDGTLDNPYVISGFVN